MDGRRLSAVYAHALATGVLERNDQYLLRKRTKLARKRHDTGVRPALPATHRLLSPLLLPY